MESPPQVAERLEFVHRLLRNRHAHMSLAVLRLGHIHFTRRCETAAIAAAGTAVRLFFNPDFFGRIDDLELAGVLAHEALHFLLRHQARSEAIVANQQDLFLFQLACDAVINDLIHRCYRDLKLPLRPVTGQELVGRDVSDNSAEEVLQMLREQGRQRGGQWIARLGNLTTIDDHEVWNSSSPLNEEVDAQWTAGTTGLADETAVQWGRSDPAWGNTPLGRERRLDSQPRWRRDLSGFLVETMRAWTHYKTNWIEPNRKLVAVYPKVIVPTYEVVQRWQVLIAIDTSGSVPDAFAAAALSCAGHPLPSTEIEVVSFDTEVYEADLEHVVLRGGGGTRIQAVEDYLRDKSAAYPDLVFAFTDGFTAPPRPMHPERWIWILPPWGSVAAVPRQSHAVFFDARAG
ncbi:MAG: hypothetical protein O2960_27395 [Verrucomicrobia bacterium]|nr:hypothetical protein [Verrucomicrobiota bacterium]